MSFASDLPHMQRAGWDISYRG